MSDHLPECGVSFACGVCGNLSNTRCICRQLRACEQRVLDEIAADGPWFRSVVHQCCEDKQTAYAAGLDASREAVEVAVTDALEALDPLDPQTVSRVLAAIDALREKP